MATDDIEIRIRPNGEIVISVEGGAEMHLDDYRRLCEAIGEITSEEIVRRPDWASPVGWAQRVGEKEVEQEQDIKHSS